MNKMRLVFEFEEKVGFSEQDFANALRKSFLEIDINVASYECIQTARGNTNKRKCEITVEGNNSPFSIPMYQLVFGSVSNIPLIYPFLTITTIEPLDV